MTYFTKMFLGQHGREDEEIPLIGGMSKSQSKKTVLYIFTFLFCNL